MARRLSAAEKVEFEAEPEAPEPEAAVTVGGRVPIPATTGAILGAVGVDADTAAVVAGVDVGGTAAAGVETGGVEETSVGFTLGVGVGGEGLAAWNGWGELEGCVKGCEGELKDTPGASPGRTLRPNGCAGSGIMSA